MEEPLRLLADRLDDTWMVVADVGHPHTADEVDERVSVHIGDRGPARLGSNDRPVHDEGPCDCMTLAFEDLAAARPRDLRA